MSLFSAIALPISACYSWVVSYTLWLGHDGCKTIWARYAWGCTPFSNMCTTWFSNLVICSVVRVLNRTVKVQTAHMLSNFNRKDVLKLFHRTYIHSRRFLQFSGVLKGLIVTTPHMHIQVIPDRCESISKLQMEDGQYFLHQFVLCMNPLLRS